ncbi:MAG: hypothetical protein HW421_816 [Ignavibacteria bacterium]|nr:hypothetical protein [Ignavibacteria bacterium]
MGKCLNYDLLDFYDLKDFEKNQNNHINQENHSSDNILKYFKE